MSAAAPLADAGLSPVEIAVTGGPLRVWRRPGSGRPIVLAHGLSQTAHFWAPVLARLPGPEAWVVDQRGHGDSDLPLPDRFGVDEAGADLAAVCRAVTGGSGSPLLIGHSWGAAATLQAAADAPAALAAAVSIDGGLITLADVAPREQMRRRLTPPDRAWSRAEFTSAMERGPLGPWWDEETAAAVLAAFAVDSSGHLRSRLGLARHMAIIEGMLDYDARDVTGRLTVQTWAVSAEGRPQAQGAAGDTYAQPAWLAARDAACAELLRRAPTVNLLRVTGAVHDLPLQWPDLVAGLIRTALRELR